MIGFPFTVQVAVGLGVPPALQLKSTFSSSALLTLVGRLIQKGRAEREGEGEREDEVICGVAHSVCRCSVKVKLKGKLQVN